MKALLTIIILGLVAWGIYAMVDKDKVNPQPTTNDQQQGINVGEPNPSTPSIKEFTVVGKPFSFLPASIRVKQGDIVRITFQNQNGTHDLVLDGFNARTKVLSAGASETIEFTADQAGTFEYYCSVGNHRQMGMVGALIVE